jgi:hypothetical protein
MSFFDVLIVDDQVIALDHLNPFTLPIDSKLAGRALKIGVRFSNHCFTRGYDPAFHPTGHPVLVDAGRRARSFCPIRYRLSLGLRELISGFVDSRTKVSQTVHRRNWVYSMTISDPHGPYHVFFELRRTPLADRQRWDLNMVVESAYPESPLRGSPSILGKISFVLLCAKVYTGKPVSTKR